MFNPLFEEDRPFEAPVRVSPSLITAAHRGSTAHARAAGHGAVLVATSPCKRTASQPPYSTASQRHLWSLIATAPPCASALPKKSMADLPSAWLLHLPEALDPLARLALFKTCRTFRDLMLSMRSVRVRYQLHMLHKYKQPAASLLLACQQSPSVSLSLTGAAGRPAAIINSSEQSLLSGAMAAAGKGLAAVKDVCLEGLELNALMPSWLVSTCPKMTSLRLDACTYQDLPAPHTRVPMLGQVRQLHVCQPPDVSGQDMFLRWQHQLRSLIGLQSLQITPEITSEPRFLECCSAVGPQLTRLCFRPTQLPAQFGLWYPCVRELDIGEALVTDKGMEVLLSVSSLRHLHCRAFLLYQDYKQAPWTHLHVAELDIASFRHLPLEDIHSLRVIRGDVFGLRLSPYQVDNVRVVAAIAKCGGLVWDGDGKEMTVMVDGERLHDLLNPDANRAPASSECLAEIFPLLSTCKASNLSIHQACVNREVLAAISKHLAGTRLSSIGFWQCRFGGQEVWPLFLPSLPPLVRSASLSQCGVSQDDVDAICAHAAYPIRAALEHGMVFFSLPRPVTEFSEWGLELLGDIDLTYMDGWVMKN